jgi:RimJ/RimL family protein N-acetyltransferase
VSITDPNFAVPTELRTAEFALRPITADDAELDHTALMETREQLRLWEQSSWPEDDFSVEANRDDLLGLEQRHGEHRAYTYTVQNPNGSECLGCVYVFPPDATFLAKATVTPVGDDAWDDLDAVVYFWVRLSQMEKGLDERLLTTLRYWLRDEWKLGRTVVVTNEQFEQQKALLEGTDLALKFSFVEPDKPGAFLAFG